jgi:hypothetical protein
MMILALIFITLKLTGVIAWSWLWVLAPIWIPLVLVLIIAAIIAIGVTAGGKLRIRRK